MAIQNGSNVAGCEVGLMVALGFHIIILDPKSSGHFGNLVLLAQRGSLENNSFDFNKSLIPRSS